MTKRFSATPWLFLAPALVLMAIFLLYPIITVFYYSLTDFNVINPPKFIGLANFQRLVNDSTFWTALRNSLLYVIVTPTLIGLSILLAIILNRKLRGIHIYRALYFVPAIAGSIAIGISWRQIFDINGVLNSVLLTLGLVSQPVQWLSIPGLTLPLAMLVTIWAGVGYYAVIFLAGLQNISEDLYDAALIDGCNGWQKHWHVTLPGLRPQIAFVAVISSLAALKVFDEIYTLTNRTGGILDSGVTMVFYLWRQGFRQEHAGYAAAIAIVLLAVTLTFSIINVRFLERGATAE
jgi:putative chitobiose transport system permease protein